MPFPSSAPSPYMVNIGSTLNPKSTFVSPHTGTITDGNVCHIGEGVGGEWDPWLVSDVASHQKAAGFDSTGGGNQCPEDGD